MPLNFNSNNVTSVNFNGTPVTKINFNGVEVWSSSPTPTVLEPFYIENPSSEDSISIQLKKKNASAPDLYLEYSDDGGTTWSTFAQDTSYTIPANEKIHIRAPQGSPNSSTSTAIANSNCFSSSSRYNAGGDITTLLEKDGGITDLTNYGTYTFCALFSNFNNNTPATLSNCSNLVLTPTTLQDYCYRNLFFNCNLITSAPALPATTLGTQCYAYMFNGCGGLTTPPTLPATTLATGCYRAMFYDSGITSAPSLPATTMTSECYCQMFANCASLTTPPTLPATTLDNACYRGMFSGCTYLTSAPALPVTSLSDNCYNQMFSACSRLTTAPDLPADTLVSNCYYQMFQYSGITSIRIAFTAWNPVNAIGSWMTSVPASGTFYCPTALGTDATIERAANRCPPGWTVINTD